MNTILKPFDRILVRHKSRDYWEIDIFMNMIDNFDGILYEGFRGIWEFCMPFEGNEKLYRTSDIPNPPHENFKFGDILMLDGQTVVFIFYLDKEKAYVVGEKGAVFMPHSRELIKVEL